MPLNLFDLPDPLPQSEVFTDLIPDRGVKIERIVSRGQNSPEGQWYDQDRDEWVALIQGEAVLEYEGGEKLQARRRGPPADTRPLPPPRGLHQPDAAVHLGRGVREADVARDSRTSGNPGATRCRGDRPVASTDHGCEVPRPTPPARFPAPPRLDSRFPGRVKTLTSGHERPLRHSRESGNPGVLEGSLRGVSPLHPAWIPAFAGMTVSGAVASLGWGVDTACSAGMTDPVIPATERERTPLPPPARRPGRP